MRNGRNLADNTELLNTHPELKENMGCIRATFGNIIFAYRMQKGYTQSELSVHSGLSLKNIISLESGTGDLGISTYEKIFKALGLSITDVGELMSSPLFDRNQKGFH